MMQNASVSTNEPRFLFIPVSAPRGSGEYARALALATMLTRRRPETICHFALSEEAPYASNCPFPATLFPSSPTFHTVLVRKLISKFCPDVVVFDNAGRTEQLRSCRDSGASIVFVSSRRRQRGRAFRLKWLRLLDVHWIAYPPFMAGPATAWERFKVNLVNRTSVQFLDCLIPTAESPTNSNLPMLLESDHVLVITGGVADSRAYAAAPRVMTEAALLLAEHRLPVVLVGAPQEVIPRNLPSSLQLMPRFSVTDLESRIRNAKVVVCNGGDTLVQVLALGRACVSIAMAPDQATRLRQCRRAGLDVQASIDARNIEKRVRTLWDSVDSRRAQLIAAERLGIMNCMNTAIDTLFRLLERRDMQRVQTEHAPGVMN